MLGTVRPVSAAFTGPFHLGKVHNGVISGSHQERSANLV